MPREHDWFAWMHYPMWVALGVLGYDAGRAIVGECEALAERRRLFGPDFEEADDEFIIEAY